MIYFVGLACIIVMLSSCFFYIVTHTHTHTHTHKISSIIPHARNFNRCTAVTLNYCGGDSDDKVADILQGDSTNLFTCTGLSSSVLWSARRTGAADKLLAECNPICASYFGDAFIANWTQPNTQNTMTVMPNQLNNKKTVESFDLVCGVPGSPNEDRCPMDYVGKILNTPDT
jgi:hypothetical protein